MTSILGSVRRSAFFLAPVVVLLSVSFGSAHAHAGLVGYSGAPGSSGTCAGACHGSGGGTIAVSGFPAQYVPNQTYLIDVTRNGGSAIKPFNASCRVGSGSDNAGEITAGSNTVTYSTPVETNGVHLVTVDANSGAFNWTAPPAGTGAVTLYLAGHQGLYTGANTVLTFTALEAVDGLDAGQGSAARGFALGMPSPNPVAATAFLRYSVPRAGLVRFEIFDVRGRIQERRDVAAESGGHQFSWDATRRTPGVYYVRMEAAGFRAVRRLVVAR